MKMIRNTMIGMIKNNPKKLKKKSKKSKLNCIYSLLVRALFLFASRIAMLIRFARQKQKIASSQEIYTEENIDLLELTRWRNNYADSIILVEEIIC